MEMEEHDYYKQAIEILTRGYRSDREEICVEVAKRNPKLFCAAVKAVEEKARELEKKKQQEGGK